MCCQRPLQATSLCQQKPPRPRTQSGIYSKEKTLCCTFFLPDLDYGDIIYMNTHFLSLLDSVYHEALRFIIGCKPQHTTPLYLLVNWSSVTSCKMAHWFHFIYKSVSGSLPSYLWDYILHKQSSHNLQSSDFITFVVPTKPGRKAFSFSASME